MMKWLLMIMSYTLTRASFKQHTQFFTKDLYQEAVFKTRKMAVIGLAGLGGIVLFCAGVIIAVLNMSAQYDLTGTVGMTATLGSGITLFAITGLGLAAVAFRSWPSHRNRKAYSVRKLRKEMREEKKDFGQSTHGYSGGALEQAISLWILDIVKEREVRRAEKTQRAFDGTDGKADINQEESPLRRQKQTNTTESSRPLH